MPKTETQKQKRAQKRREQRQRRHNGDQKRPEKAEGFQPPVAAVSEEPQLQTPSASISPSPTTPTAPDYSPAAIVGAIGQLANIVTELKDSMLGAVGELAQGQEQLSQRILTIEQAQALGVDSLATQSGLGLLGLSGQVQGEQGMLVQSSSYRAIRETEAQILSEEGFDLAIPQDGHTIIVGAITESEVRSRREALQKAVNEQYGGRF